MHKQEVLLGVIARGLHFISASTTTVAEQISGLIQCMYYEELCANLMFLAALALPNIL